MQAAKLWSCFQGLEHRKLMRIAAPMILTNVSFAILGIVDTAVVGHLGHAYYIGAIAVATIIFDFLYWSMAFLRMGTTGLVAQIHGEGDSDRMRSSLAQALATALLLASVMLIAQTPIVEIALSLLHGSEEVHLHARRYFYIAIWGAPALLSLMVIHGWFIGMQNARAPLIIAIVFNLINIALDFVFVFGFGMDVIGVAWAAVIAEWCGLALSLYLVTRELDAYRGQWRRELMLDLAALKRMLLLNGNIMIRSLCLIFTFAFFTSQSAAQGDEVLAANSVLLKFLILMALALDGFANAAEALVGRAIGARDRVAFQRAVTAACVWSALIAVGFSVAYALLGDALIGLITDIAEVRWIAAVYLPWMVLMPVTAVWCFLLDGIFIGATRGIEMRNTMLVAVFAVFLPVWYFSLPLGNHGLWSAFTLFMVARGVTLGIYYFRIERREGFVASMT